VHLPRVPGIDLKSFLKLSVSIGLLAWVIHGIDVEEFRSVLSSLPATYLILAAALILLQIPVLTHRWFRILLVLGERAEWVMVCKATYVGIFFNQALPGSVGGDIIRIAQLRANGMSLRVSANSVILERLSGLYALVLLMVALSPVVETMLPGRSLVVPAASLGGLVTVGFIILAYVDRLIPDWRHFAFARKALAAVRSDYLRLIKDPGTVVYTLLLGAISWSLNLWAIYLLAIGVGIEIPVVTCFFFGGLSVLASVLPISMAGWGVREGAMVALFGLVGIAPAQAMTVSVTFGVLMVLTSLPAGLLWLRSAVRCQQREYGE
jgi:uncharacterized membrane protein YbhN (UPF0104 family)